MMPSQRQSHLQTGYQYQSSPAQSPCSHLSDQNSLTTNRSLYEGGPATDHSLTRICDHDNNLIHALSSYKEQIQAQSEVYAGLEKAYKKTRIDLDDMSRAYDSLRAQFNTASQCYDRSVQEYERDLQVRQQLESREHQNAQAQASRQLHTAQQDLSKLRKEKEDLIRELGAAEDRVATALKRTMELEKRQAYEQLSLEELAKDSERRLESVREHRAALDAAEKQIAELKEEKVRWGQEQRDKSIAAEDQAMVVTEMAAQPDNENVRVIRGASITASNQFI
ncbi:MAG: hypothetical protein CL912_11600 [Deltaproteobacteria bacterium]|nr:hypothetical protein [Deltaproteobacteria bacterium]